MGECLDQDKVQWCWGKELVWNGETWFGMKEKGKKTGVPCK